jgi:hypothetical protein
LKIILPDAMKKIAFAFVCLILFSSCGGDVSDSETSTNTHVKTDSTSAEKNETAAEVFDPVPSPVFLKTISALQQEGYSSDSLFLAKKEKSKDTLYPHKFSWLKVDSISLIDLTYAVYKPLDKTDSSALNKATKVVAWHYLKETGKKFYSLAEGMLEEWEFTTREEAEKANDEMSETGAKYYPEGAWMNTVHENKLYVVHSFNVMYFIEMSEVFEKLKMQLKELRK